MVRIIKTSDSQLPVVAQFTSALLLPAKLKPLILLGIHCALLKMADKGKWKFTRNNQLQGKRLQKNLRFCEASCWPQNRGKILVDSSCSVRWSSACSEHKDMYVLTKSASRLFKTWLFRCRYTLLLGIVGRDCSSLCLHFFFWVLLVLILIVTNYLIGMLF